MLKLIVAVVFMYLGVHLIVKNEIVAKTISEDAGLLETKEIDGRKRVSSVKLKFNRGVLYIAGTTSFGFGIWISIKSFL